MRRVENRRQLLCVNPALPASPPSHTDPLGFDSLQPLSSVSATLSMQQAMLGGTDDSMDGTEEEEEEEEEEGMEEEEEEEDEEEEETIRQKQSDRSTRV